MAAFDFDDSGPLRRRVAGGPGWLVLFSAQFAATLLAGALLVLGIRFWIHRSIEESGKEFQKAIAAGIEKGKR